MGVVGVLNGAFPPWFAARSALVDARDGNPQVAPPAEAPPDSADGLVLEVPADSRHDEPFGIGVRCPAPRRGRSPEHRCRGDRSRPAC